jgi:hypothetical protein
MTTKILTGLIVAAVLASSIHPSACAPFSSPLYSGTEPATAGGSVFLVRPRADAFGALPA